MELELSQDVERVAWDELVRVFELAPLGRRDPARLEAAFRNSAHCCFVYHQTRLIAAGRALSDGVSHAAIYDVVVLPEYQHQGIGRRVVEDLVARANVPTVVLYAVPGREGFYGKLGFRRMRTAMALFKNPQWQQDNGYIE